MEYTFINLPYRKFVHQEDKGIQNLLRKWSMLGRVTCHAYAFNQEFQAYNLKQFVESLVKSPAVASTLEVWRGQYRGPLGTGAQVESVAEVPCSLTSMAVFRKVFEAGIVMEDGDIKKCPDEYHEDLVLDDLLKKVLVDTSEEVFSREDRRQLLFRLFRLLALGGECCQFEDNIYNYLSVTRTLYRDLVSPEADGERVVVTSIAAELRLKTSEGVRVPEESEVSQNVLLLVINPQTRTLTTLLHQHGVGDMD
ncbi:cilia- and flagella-associated protein 300-like [Penaeus chinensis]|uniref:cilia- and flagella-associated protein 300-like n=1 Tax=Penaeus chinensis TaxID=139456 RepID=UPI001FB7357E|nr:cilia- and flagella-associated protein 300-like [Penaeus chinensis]